MKMRKSVLFILMVMFLFVVGCAGPNSNTSVTNIGVTSYETTGVLLTQAFTVEKALLKAGKITAIQDENFQLGVYAKAVSGYKAVGTAAVAVLMATDSDSKKTAQDKFNALNAQLPMLLSDVIKFLETIKK